MEDRIPGGLQHCHKTCCEKGGRHGRRACMVQRWHHRGDVVFRTGGLVYDTEPDKLNNFLFQCHLYFHANPAQFDTDIIKINFTMTYLTGVA